MGGATGPQVGETVNAQPVLDDGGEGFCGCDTILILIFSLVRITFVVGFLRIKIHVASARICQMSNVLIRCSNKVFHTTKAHYHQAGPYPLSNPPWLIRNQWSMVNTIFDTLKWKQMDLYNEHLIPTIYSHAAQKVGLNSFQCNCLPPFQPYQPLPSEDSLVPPFSHLWYRRLESGVGAESTWVNKRKVGGATGPQVGERVNAQPMLDDGGEGSCGAILF